MAHPKLEILDPCKTIGWDRLIAHMPGASFFHSQPWAEVLSQTYGYRPCYVVLRSQEDPYALLPLMDIRSHLTGKRGVSLPFSDKVSILAPDGSSFGDLFCSAKEIGIALGWRYVDFRGAPLPLDIPTFSTYLNHFLRLNKKEKDLLHIFSKGTRSSIKKAAKANLEVSFDSDLIAMKHFFSLHTKTRRAHGLPPQPWRFFKNVQNKIVSTGNGTIATVSCHRKPISSAVIFFHHPNAFLKYAASDRNYLHLRPNNLLYWEVIRLCQQKGFEILDFGRTDKGNEGLARFKKSWGADEDEIRYHRFDLGRAAFVSGRNGPATSYPFFRLLPLPVLRLIGACLYRHLG